MGIEAIDRKFRGTQDKWVARENGFAGSRWIEIIAPPMDGTKDHVNIVAKLDNLDYKSKQQGGNYSHNEAHQINNVKLLTQAPETLKALQQLVKECKKLTDDLGDVESPAFLKAIKKSESLIKKVLL
ncbi:MAG: hypothetical protein AAGC43_04710 [Bacteroidota bacterium]